MGLRAKEQSRIMTKGNDTISLPKEIIDALLQDYDVYIKKEVKDGVISAKVTFHKVRFAGREFIADTKH